MVSHTDMKQSLQLRSLTIVLCLICSYGYADSKTEQLVRELNKQIGKSVEYDLAKTLRIGALRQQLQKTHNLSQQFELTNSIYKEYEVFNFDSAFFYVSKLEELGKTLRDPQKVGEARVNQIFILLSSGMFKEASEIVNSINPSGMSGADRANYYMILARYNIELFIYSIGSHFSSQYLSKSTSTLDSALKIYNKISFEYQYGLGLKYFLLGDMEKCKKNLDTLYTNKRLNLRQQALLTSTMSAAYFTLNQYERGEELLLEAAIADTRASNKEETALASLARIFYKRDRYDEALLWIEKASSNADYYGARHRKAQLTPVMQVIQGAKIKAEEQKRAELLKFTVLVCFVLVGVIVFSFVFYQQVQKLRKIRRALTEVNEKLNVANQDNETFIERLKRNNKALREADRIKEEYISYFMNVDSDLFEKVDRLKKAVEKKAAENKMSEVLYLVNRFSLKNEKKDALQNFDKVFLRIFPDFVYRFNSLFDAKDQLVLKDGELMNTELRIFALIRMGITNNEKIAQILEYSVNTIYTYKTKIKNKSDIPNEEFEDRLNLLVQVGQD